MNTEEKKKGRACIRQASEFAAGRGDRWRSEALNNGRQEDEEDSGESGGGRGKANLKAREKLHGVFDAQPLLQAVHRDTIFHLFFF